MPRYKGMPGTFEYNHPFNVQDQHDVARMMSSHATNTHMNGGWDTSFQMALESGTLGFRPQGHYPVHVYRGVSLPTIGTAAPEQTHVHNYKPVGKTRVFNETIRKPRAVFPSRAKEEHAPEGPVPVESSLQERHRQELEEARMQAMETPPMMENVMAAPQPNNLEDRLDPWDFMDF